MPIKLKKTISTIEELTCENCIQFQNDPSGNSVCINPESYDWHTEKDECCSQGQWFKAMYYDDSVEINLFGFSSMVHIFAEEELDATKNQNR